LICEEEATGEEDRFEPLSEQERLEQVEILRAFRQDKEGLAQGTVVGYMGKFAAFWRFRESSKHERGGERDLFLLSTPVDRRRDVWLDYIGYLVEVRHIKGQSCFEHLSATKKVLMRNGLLDLSFADDSDPVIRDAKAKAKFTEAELHEMADAAAQRKKLPMFEELEDKLYQKLWIESEEDIMFVKMFKRGIWLGIALMTMTGARPSNIVVTMNAKHTLWAKDATVMLIKDGAPSSERFVSGGDPWPDGFVEQDVAGTEVTFHSHKSGQVLGRKVFPGDEVRTIRLNQGMGWWFRHSGVKPDDMLLTMYRQPIGRRFPGGPEQRLLRDTDLAGHIMDEAYYMGFGYGHFSCRSCRIGLVTRASWGAGVDWDNPDAQHTARMGGWANARQTGAMRRHYDLSRVVHREMHPDLALKFDDVWEMLPYREREKKPRPPPDQRTAAIGVSSSNREGKKPRK